MSRMLAKRFYSFDIKFCFDRNSNYICTIDNEIEYLRKSSTNCGQFAFFRFKKNFIQNNTPEIHTTSLKMKLKRGKKRREKEKKKTVVGMMMNDFISNKYLLIIYIKRSILQFQTLSNI